MSQFDVDPFDEPAWTGRRRPVGRRPLTGPRHFVAVPRAGTDPIDKEATALALISLAMSVPCEYETLAILLDHQRCGISVVSVADTVDPESVVRVADMLAESALRCDDIGGVVIASIRPGAGDELDDLERWFTIDEELDRVGVELVEWFVLGSGVSRPRSMVGEAERWVA